jgi:hypothetical protein
MADAAVNLEASNLFGLHANFNTTASTTSVVETNVAVNDEVGNVECQRNIADITNYTQSASYCGSDFVADMGTFLTKFGDLQTIGVVTGLTVNMTASGYVTIDITGHQHATNAHAAGLTLGYADVSDFFPHEVGEAFEAWDGFGVPDFGVTLGADSSFASASVTFSMNHVDQMDEAGDHLVGKNITPRCELSADFVGVPTSNTAALLEADFDANTNDMLVPLVDSTDTNDSNSDFDTFAFAAHANTDLAIA